MSDRDLAKTNASRIRTVLRLLGATCLALAVLRAIRGGGGGGCSSHCPCAALLTGRRAQPAGGPAGS